MPVGIEAILFGFMRLFAIIASFTPLPVVSTKSANSFMKFNLLGFMGAERWRVRIERTLASFEAKIPHQLSIPLCVFKISILRSFKSLANEKMLFRSNFDLKGK